MWPTTPAPQRYVRYILKAIGKAGLRLLTRTACFATERIPRRGPFIIAGNHRAAMEIFLMLVATRPQVDIIGAGDIPLDPSLRFLARAYGYIPYRRGSVDGKALRRAQRVLESGGVVGIFPEGGIWTDGPKETQRGVAWLAAQTGAPVVPMGFAGIDDGIGRTFSLQFPRFEVHVGTPISLHTDSVTRSGLDEFSRAVMNQVDELLPDWDRAKKPRPIRRSHSLELRWGPNTECRVLHRDDPQAQAISRFYHLPVLLSIFEVNLRRDVSALKAWKTAKPAREIERALTRVLGYIRLRNKHLFTYRLGMAQGTLLAEAFASLRDWVRELPDQTPVMIVPHLKETWPEGTVETFTSPR